MHLHATAVILILVFLTSCLSQFVSPLLVTNKGLCRLSTPVVKSIGGFWFGLFCVNGEDHLNQVTAGLA